MVAVCCTCYRREADDTRDEVFKLLEVIDLRSVSEQAAAIPDLMVTVVRHLQKSERTERLGLGADVAQLYREAAERDHAQAIRQLRAVIARLDERTGRDDWGDLVERARREFEEHEGLALVADAKGRLRLAMLELDGVSGDEAARTAAAFDESLDRVVRDPLSGAAQLLREALERGLEALQTPEMGRQPASPQTGARQFCMNVSYAIAAAMMVACIFAPFCWCCGAPSIGIWLAANLAGCLLNPE